MEMSNNQKLKIQITIIRYLMSIPDLAKMLILKKKYNLFLGTPLKSFKLKRRKKEDIVFEMCRLVCMGSVL